MLNNDATRLEIAKKIHHTLDLLHQESCSWEKLPPMERIHYAVVAGIVLGQIEDMIVNVPALVYPPVAIGGQVMLGAGMGVSPDYALQIARELVNAVDAAKVQETDVNAIMGWGNHHG